MLGHLASEPLESIGACRHDHSAMELYLGRVQGLLIALDAMVPPGALSNAERLVEHGEPAEGLAAAAWVISNSDSRVPQWIVDDIYEMTAGLVALEHLPEDLNISVL
jgi:hypothetical protein